MWKSSQVAPSWILVSLGKWLDCYSSLHLSVYFYSGLVTCPLAECIQHPKWYFVCFTVLKNNAPCFFHQFGAADSWQCRWRVALSLLNSGNPHISILFSGKHFELTQKFELLPYSFWGQSWHASSQTRGIISTAAKAVLCVGEASAPWWCWLPLFWHLWLPHLQGHVDHDLRCGL